MKPAQTKVILVPIFCWTSGETNAMTRFIPQLPAVARVTHLLARRVGKTSAATTQAAKEREGQYCGTNVECSFLTQRTKRGREPRDEQAAKGDQSLARLGVVGPGSGQRASDDLTGEHDDGASEQDAATAEAVDSEQARERHDNIDGGQDDEEDVRVVEAGSLRELNTV